MAPRIVVSGGTGFLGRPLTLALAAHGHEVVVLTRGGAAASASPQLRHVAWTPDGSAAGAWAAEVDGAAAVINLAGESIAGGRWTAARKQLILDSRLQATRSLVTAIQAARNPPPVFVSGSAVGYYGPRGDERITEDSPPGSDFLATVCVRWEAEASNAASAATRVVALRTGLVLARDGGALRAMLPPFRIGAGGPVGSGRQYWPWIHRDDWIAIVLWTVAAPDAAGAVNLTAPEPVTNADFARALGLALRRPAFMPAPAFMLRLLLGEMADALLLSGQRAVPRRAEQAGVQFVYPRLTAALKALF
jgi:uncharacterized protein (TIGR01777 family)